MYEAPIKMMQHQLRTEEENGILKAIMDVGVVVNKEELIKALQYDRGQYDKGYNDGYLEGIKEFAERLKKEALKHKIFPLDSCVDIDDINNLVKEMTEVEK